MWSGVFIWTGLFSTYDVLCDRMSRTCEGMSSVLLSAWFRFPLTSFSGDSRQLLHLCRRVKRLSSWSGPAATEPAITSPPPRHPLAVTPLVIARLLAPVGCAPSLLCSPALNYHPPTNFETGPNPGLRQRAAEECGPPRERWWGGFNQLSSVIMAAKLFSWLSVCRSSWTLLRTNSSHQEEVLNKQLIFFFLSKNAFVA